MLLFSLTGCAVWEEGRPIPPGEDATRSVTLEVEPLRQEGKFLPVRLSGEVSSDDPLCVATQEVVIESLRVGGDRWVALGSDLTDDSGSYSFKLDVRSDEEIRAVVPLFSYCEAATSSTRHIGG
jgi:hypothetical protein